MGYKCPICSNANKDYFYVLNDKIYCRKCISFAGEHACKEYQVNEGDYILGYNLTDDQKKASEFMLRNIIEWHDCAINAVCGAGKTEIIYETLRYCTIRHLKIGIAIPRKDVVMELEERISKDFNVKTIGVYGGHHEILEGDIIIFTTHQAFRYIGYFDVVIIDEVDAFPYKSNVELQNIVKKCGKNFVYLSATMPKYIEKDNNISKFYLNKRYHGFPLPVPKCKQSLNIFCCLRKNLKKYKNKKVLVYFPTIKLQEKISKKLKCDYLVNSKTEDRKEILQKLKNIDKGVIFTTTILERGITIKDVQVIVYFADHKLFNKDILIQISGRVGRHKDFYRGEVIFICKNKNKEIKEAIKTIEKYNE